jgi:hypothetical protein
VGLVVVLLRMLQGNMQSIVGQTRGQTERFHSFTAECTAALAHFNGCRTSFGNSGTDGTFPDMWRDVASGRYWPLLLLWRRADGWRSIRVVLQILLDRFVAQHESESPLRIHINGFCRSSSSKSITCSTDFVPPSSVTVKCISPFTSQ